MAEDSETSEEVKPGRAHHAPQHASAKHERRAAAEQPEDTGPAENEAADKETMPAGMPSDVIVRAESDRLLPEGPRRSPRRLWTWLGEHKRLSVPLGIVLLLAVLGAVPFTRYALAGTVIRRDFSVQVVDSQTHKPVTSATVWLEGKTATTNNKGAVTIRANAGSASLMVSKKYYTAVQQGVLVPLGKQQKAEQVVLVATGRQVPISVTNKVSGAAVADVTISAQGSEAKTDAKGEATLVLPAGKAVAEATLKGAGYNTIKVNVKVTAATDPANKFQVTPSGKLYFLSNKNGTIDVVKTNLDGSDRQTVLAGTGKEDKYNTVLLASQDWQYLALLSKRDGGENAKLFLINTSDDSVTTMDEGNAAFTLVGWSGHRFVYRVDRNGYKQWQANRQALKSYDAASAKTAILDQTAAGGNDGGYFSESFDTVYIYSDEIVYGKSVSANSGHDAEGHDATLNTVKSDGSDKRAIKSWGYSLPYPWYSYVTITVGTRAYEPNAIYASISIWPEQAGKDDNLYEYEGGQLKTVAGKKATDIYDGDYSTYLLSPSDRKTFWSEPRDGKATLFVGDSDGKNGKEVASLSDYQTYGWFTEKYLLLSKKGSELYIMPVAGGSPTKITDYFKPNVSFTGYGKGYGGL